MPWARYYDNHKLMGRSIPDNQKKRGRGRPRTGVTPMTGVRFSAELLTKIQKWARNQPDKPNKAEAIQRLVEHALGGMASTHSSARKITARKVGATRKFRGRGKCEYVWSHSSFG